MILRKKERKKKNQFHLLKRMMINSKLRLGCAAPSAGGTCIVADDNASSLGLPAPHELAQ